MSARDKSEKQVQRALPRARLIITAAERDLRRQLSDGERRDLLKDQTQWSNQAIEAIVASVDGEVVS